MAIRRADRAAREAHERLELEAKMKSLLLDSDTVFVYSLMRSMNNDLEVSIELIDQANISSTQLILQNMIGKIAGPMYGMWLYDAWGQTGFALGVIAINALWMGFDSDFNPEPTLTTAHPTSPKVRGVTIPFPLDL